MARMSRAEVSVILAGCFVRLREVQVVLTPCEVTAPIATKYIVTRTSTNPVCFLSGFLDPLFSCPILIPTRRLLRRRAPPTP